MELFPEFEFEESKKSDDPQPPALRKETLRELYRLAGKLRLLEPWKELRDEDLLGIEDPENGELMILSVLGRAKQVYALQLYHGDEGISFWNEVIETGEAVSIEIAYRLRLLECGFVNKGDADPHDLDMQKRHGEVSRKRHSSAAFRSHRPGYFPWFLEEPEAAVLIRTMRLFLHFFEAFEFQVSGTTHFPELNGRPAIPVLRLVRGGDADVPSDWEIGEIALPLPKAPAVPDEPEDELFAARLETLPVVSEAWEIAAFYLPNPVFEGERPYFPKVAICIGPDQFLPPDPVIYGGERSEDAVALRNAFENLANLRNCLPGKVRVASETGEVALRALSRGTGVAIVCEAQEFLPAVAASMMQLFGKDPEEIMNDLLKIGESEPGGNFPFLFGNEASGGSGAEPVLPKPIGRERYTLRIDLMGTQPPVWRRITIPADATFFHLHVAIQDVMGWESCHLYDFSVGKGRQPRRIGPPMAECEIDYEITLKSALGGRVKEFFYEYDFGDSWVHKIKVESKTKEDEPDPNPRVVKGKGIAPPEDCGGIWGFQELLDGTSDWCEEMEPEYLDYLRNGVFEIADVEFCDPEPLLKAGGMMF